MTYRDNPEIAKKYKSKKWEKLRKAKLLLNPLCERCLKKDLYNAAIIVHHKEYISDTNYNDDNIFFNINNLESLCRKCHNEEHFREKDSFAFDAEGEVINLDPPNA